MTVKPCFAAAAIVVFAMVASAGDEVATTPTPEAEPTVYGDTPEELVPYGRFTEPYKTFFLEPNQYRGYGRHIPEPEHVDTVKIGFLGPIEATVSVATGGASHEEPLGRKMLQGAQLAIEHANARGGYRGSKVPYELVVRNDNGLWGASGNEIVDLAYKENVWAILGTIDGANSHIAMLPAGRLRLPRAGADPRGRTPRQQPLRADQHRRVS
jgi:ABC-type branched-subunit amino acid transport system substrate-binding protein